jgi:hypothetical protein
MVAPITHVNQTQAAAQPKVPQSSSPPKTQPAPKDTVTLSAAAALHQELTETSVQTAREAGNGDIQARNLLAREAADKKAGL